MLWKTLILLAVTAVVLAERVKKHQSSYEFHINHDYDYNHHKKHEHKVENEAENNEEQEQTKEENNKEAEQEENNNEEEQVQQEDAKEEEQQNEGEGGESHKPKHHHDEHKYSAYEFLYKVEDHHKHDIKGHHEKKDGENIKGAYWLWQPDGYKRTVKYEASKHHGFKAEVDYSKIEEHKDEEKHEEGHHNPKSEYYITIYHGLKEPTPIKEDVSEDQEQDKQEESAQHIPIYVI